MFFGLCSTLTASHNGVLESFSDDGQFTYHVIVVEIQYTIITKLFEKWDLKKLLQNTYTARALRICIRPDALCEHSKTSLKYAAQALRNCLRTDALRKYWETASEQQQKQKQQPKQQQKHKNITNRLSKSNFVVFHMILLKTNFLQDFYTNFH